MYATGAKYTGAVEFVGKLFVATSGIGDFPLPAEVGRDPESLLVAVVWLPAHIADASLGVAPGDFGVLGLASVPEPRLEGGI